MATFPELRGRTVLITGGANGIGAAMVRAFHTQGAHVFFCDIDRTAGRKLEVEMGSDIRFKKVDLRREREVNAWVANVAAQGHGVSVLINNAARDPRRPLPAVSVA